MDFKYFVSFGSDEKPAFHQTEKNTAFPGRNVVQSDFVIAVDEKGICINGDYGINPSAEEMREAVEIMRICVAAFDQLNKGQ